MKIGLASPDKIRAWSYGVVEQSRNNQLQNTEARKRRSVLRKDIWSYKGLGVFLR